ncbi:SET domain-containing protein [Bimuria novae-zelandiae CBS 107.79]|uniref:SET domain-containing protein n=1 Tax=Bimuria novae-zelandiae CBS 107.79 TaxID=1447943 RepID=A0A6A5VMG7_9PLEO|nr:SET domain-containing protein [Bimuria novae-zelandiae CBS 107.79]
MEGEEDILDSPPPPGAPTSHLFEVRHTPHSGRAVFAVQDIPADTLVYLGDDLTLEVVLKEYRREVCGECFGYDRGRGLSVRDASVGFVFCSQDCKLKWCERVGELGVKTWTVVQTLVKDRSKEDSDMVDVGVPRPKAKEIRIAWEATTEQAASIRIAREADGDKSTDNGVKVTKQHRKAVQKALMQPISPDIMAFCVSGLLWKHNNPQDWDRFVALADDDTPYHSYDDLRAFTRTYLHMLAICPVTLLPHITPENLFMLSSRDSHNSFGIRSLEDEGSEFFGYGCWPSASYFNHSCGNNIEKQRVGRVWHFRAGRYIKQGDELCITYLSGEERQMSKGKRMKTLKTNWGFECQCERCEEM